jgi:origin recognition complex subunit 1
VSGDARRALELCRRAVEIAEEHLQPSMSNHVSMDLPRKASEREALQSSQGLLQSGSKLIGMSHVEAAISEMFQAPHIQVNKSQPL